MPTPSPQQDNMPLWDPKNVLKCDPERSAFCAGVTKTGRSCRLTISRLDAAGGAELIDELARLDPFSAEACSIMEDLAPIALCKRWHRCDQVQNTLNRWFRAIRHHDEQDDLYLQTVSRTTSSEDPSDQILQDPIASLHAWQPLRTATASDRHPGPSRAASHLSPSIEAAMRSLLSLLAAGTHPPDSTITMSLPSTVPNNSTTVSITVRPSTEHQRRMHRSTSTSTSISTPSSSTPPTSPPSISTAPQPAEARSNAPSPPPSLVHSPLPAEEHNGVIRRPLADECPICRDEMNLSQELTWCRAHCGQNFHADCMDHWADSSRDEQRGNCPFCRSAWVAEDE